MVAVRGVASLFDRSGAVPDNIVRVLTPLAPQPPTASRLQVPSWTKQIHRKDVMSRKSAGTGVDNPWLNSEQQRVWLAWMRISLRMDYEINRELQDDGGLSHSDYHVLVALGAAPGAHMQLSDLANTIGWERSRLSHHLQRMTRRGLTERVPSTTDRRATDAVLTPAGRRALADIAPRHAAFIRGLFFGDLAGEDLPTFARLLERVYDGILERGTLPPPPTPGTESGAGRGTAPPSG